MRDPHEVLDFGPSMEREVGRMRDWIRAHIDHTGMRRLVLGLSGGIDSAVVALLAARAIGGENLLLMCLPYGLIKPSRHAPSAPDSLDHARLVVKAIGNAKHVVLDIAPAVDELSLALGIDDSLTLFPGHAKATLALGNLKARVRANLLYGQANLQGDALVTGTENRTEHLLGYFTLHGDAASDFEILSDFTKTEVRALAGFLGVPTEIIAKAPSADLWNGQTDEEELGFQYSDADQVLAWIDRDGYGPKITEAIGYEVTNRVLARIHSTAFKREPKPSYRRET